MATTPIRGKNFLLVISPNGGTDKYTLVCLTKHSFDSERTETSVKTQCGTLVDVDEPDSEINVEGVNNTTPAALAANVGEASYELLLGWYHTATEITVYRRYPTADGNDVHIVSVGKISKIGDVVEVGKYQTFTMKIKLSGDLDVTP